MDEVANLTNEEKSEEEAQNLDLKNQAHEYSEEILEMMLKKAQKFDKGLPKIEEFLESIDQNMQMLEECHCLIIRLIR